MSLPIAITDILHGHAVEWERLEFKENWNPLKGKRSGGMGGCRRSRPAAGGRLVAR
ncbi:hypothetical protein [Myxococcus qinghaiensis]|uniref:hypothetical protein n=1 Tax=Myxococcus qinghaiensis TaxID=2906758 RepID=UPI0020A7449F|nr:hypothetical protein [Myxococcus qinghaiensis]MCP3170168.1 hypothetical protein [Myxococcus qinghaiensis]